MKNIFKITVSFCWALLPLATHAQATEDSTTQKWYQVELFIFANSNPYSIVDEQWPEELGLKYPQKLTTLKEEAVTELLIPLEYQSSSSSLLSDINDNRSEVPQDSSGIESPNQPSDKIPLTQPLPDKDSPPASQPLTAITIEELPFTVLDNTELELKATVRRISSQPDFRMLFYKAWRQPIGKRNEMDNLLIRGGEQFDDHYELEGTIKLSVERYLHITTDLWLSSFASNFGREDQSWPILPKPPVSLPVATTGPEQGLFTQSTMQFGKPFNNPFSDIENKLFAIERIATLRQQRRMRSGELHYIDHPLMGLLIKITPYERPIAEPLTEDVNESSEPPLEAVTTEKQLP